MRLADRGLARHNATRRNSLRAAARAVGAGASGPSLRLSDGAICTRLDQTPCTSFGRLDLEGSVPNLDGMPDMVSR
jgi:hypothetical protein